MSEGFDWQDALDDLSHVYVPPGGLVGIEVAGGEAHLKAGSNEGWLASEIIECPKEQRYDLVLIEAVAQGASKVQVTLLDPSKDPMEVGFANETIPNFVKLETKGIDIYDLDRGRYPSLRIQVNLVAGGTDRPRLLSWSLRFVGLDEWRDDFLCDAKLGKTTAVNITDGALELDLSRKLGHPGQYPRYPTVLASRFGAPPLTYDALCALSDRSAYNASLGSIDAHGAAGFAFDDLDGDGDIDLVLVCVDTDSQIQWGTGEDSWTSTGATTLQTSYGRRGATGDLNGDGWPDIVIIGRSGYGTGNMCVFLNKGAGSFDASPDLNVSVFNPRGVDAGDINGDGYADIVVAADTYSYAYLGGPDGPDSTADKTFSTGYYYGDVLVADLDGDDHQDVIIGLPLNSKVQVFMGGDGDIDTTADYRLDIGNFYCSGIGAGDVNGDGYVDIVALPYSQDLYVFEGSGNGWNDSQRHHIALSYYADDLAVADLDKDGFVDIIVGAGMYLLVYLGGEALPTAPNFTRTGAYWPEDLKVAIPRTTGPTCYVGSFVTDAIALPDGMRWDVAVLEGSVPSNTSVLVSILDAFDREIAGLKDVPSMDVDLASIKADRCIKVKVTLSSELPGTTPRLDALRVQWTGKDTWREQFLGAAKVERMMNAAVVDGGLRTDVQWWSGHGRAQVLFTSSRGDAGYDTSPALYTSWDGRTSSDLLDVTGTSAVDSNDVNGDGLSDLVFAVHRTSDTSFHAESPLFLGHPTGFMPSPSFEFPTVGAKDVLLSDLNRDGHVDVVFAQEQDGATYRVDSTLFWGSSAGWNATPDVRFATNGGSDAEAADLDGDGRLDLVFACYRGDSTSTDSMVFLQGPTGFCGTSPSHRLPTLGARGVAVGDIDGDGHLDAVFANSFSGGSTQIDSFVYWGKEGGGFEATPGRLPTVGAEDVALGGFDTKGGLDIVFANFKDNMNDHHVDSYIYFCDGSRDLPSGPSVTVPTVGAVAVIAAELNDVAPMDLVLACNYDGTSQEVPSMILEGPFPSDSVRAVPTVGATDALVGGIMPVDRAAYMSRPITPDDPRETGGFHTLRYTAGTGPGAGGVVQLIDATTWAVLAQTELKAGTNEWVIDGSFRLRDHPSVRILVTAGAIDHEGDLIVDDLWLNWTSRVKQGPRVLGVEADPPSLLRMTGGTLTVEVMDEYDAPDELRMTVELRVSGTEGWGARLLGAPVFTDGVWGIPVFARADAPVGPYDIRIDVTDTDDMHSGPVVFEGVLEVRNNLPSPPVVRIVPEAPLTTTALRVEVITPASDVETGVVYRYRWSRDGTSVEGLTEDAVNPTLTSRGENWSVEVRAFDGLDEGPPATAWVVIHNAPPGVATPLSNPEFPEDTVDDRWVNLANAFEDPDGDQLAYSVATAPRHIDVVIDQATGKVTLTPPRDWNGAETITFVASDGELQATQTVLVTVTPVNDAPRFTTLNGEPITEDPVPFEVGQGGLLTIVVGAEDVEGDRLTFSVNTTAVEVDPATGQMRFQPGNDVVGALRYTLTMYDEASPDSKVRLNMVITVTDVNDPPADTRITNPQEGDRFKVNKTFSLIGTCTDPDTPFGQVLDYTWWWNGTHLLGRGSSLTVSFDMAGNYSITLNVTDGEYSGEASVDIVIEPRETAQPPPPPPPPAAEDRLSAYVWIGVLVGLVVLGGVVFLVVARRRAIELEAADEEEEKREAIRQMATAVRETAEQLEAEVRAASAMDGVSIETLGPGGEATKVTPDGIGSLAIRPQETETPSEDVQKLFQDVARRESVPPPEDAEAMRLEGLRRKYQTAISRLPYGIPSADLRDRDWSWLANALATGEGRTLPDGRETTRIEDRWYYSDVKDASSFLKEHAEVPKAEVRAPSRIAPKMDRAELLARLEERFVLGEITEESYRELKRKYDR